MLCVLRNGSGERLQNKKLIIAALLFCVMALVFPFPAAAGYTPVGIASSKSYVSASDGRPVILFAGDSRSMMCTFPGGNLSARSNFVFCWVNGGNVNVIREGGALAPVLEKMIRRYRKRCVVALNFGVNGNSNPKSNARRIIRIYRRWMKRWPGVPFYVVSVNPTILSSGPYSNLSVIALNERLRKEFEPEGIYIDTYGMLTGSGLVTGRALGMRDQYHYNWNAAKKVLNTVRRFTRKKEEQE